MPKVAPYTQHSGQERTQLALAARQARAQRAALARLDPSEFCAFVLRDERTGKPIKQAPAHERIHELATKHDQLIIIAHIELGKTSQLIGRVLWELGKNPSLRVAIISNTKDLAIKIVRQLGQYIEKSAELREVFPHLRPTTDPGLPWRSLALTIDRPGAGGKDPSVQAAGMHGNIIGSRVDLLVCDDILDPENTRTPVPRQDALNWIKSSVLTRLTADARMIFVGNAWHPEDALHMLAKEPGYHCERFPVIDAQGKVTWPQAWSLERIQKFRTRLGPLEYARQLLCQPRDDSTARFKREWLEGCLKRGVGLRFHHTAESFLRTGEARYGGDPNGGLRPVRFFTGVDLAVQSKETSDLTVFFTIAVYDTDELAGVRRILSIEAGHWGGPETIKKIDDHHNRYGSIQIIENNAAQDFILQFAAGMSKATLRPFTTGRNKAHPEFGVESLAAEFAANRWVVPCEMVAGKATLSKEIDEWFQELLFYEPPPKHTGDRHMAGWFAREGAALEERRTVEVGEEGSGW